LFPFLRRCLDQNRVIERIRNNARHSLSPAYARRPEIASRQIRSRRSRRTPSRRRWSERRDALLLLLLLVLVCARLILVGVGSAVHSPATPVLSIAVWIIAVIALTKRAAHAAAGTSTEAARAGAASSSPAAAVSAAVHAI